MDGLLELLVVDDGADLGSILYNSISAEKVFGRFFIVP
jgi:hypothetical protein